MQKIMFNEKYGLQSATITRKKTQTRRFLSDSKCNRFWYNEQNRLIYMKNEFGNEQVAPKNMQPRYKVGELVAIAQSYSDILGSEYLPPRQEEKVCKLVSDGHVGCTNKMYVSADLMPHHIIISDIRVERLQEISDADCLKEGVCVAGNISCCRYYVPGLVDKKYMDGIYCDEEKIMFRNGVMCTPFYNARSAFESLINKIEGSNTWDSNPWVVVYDFQRYD